MSEDEKDALSLTEAARYCNVTKYAVFNWAAEGLLDVRSIVGHKSYSKQQLTHLLAVRATNPRNWKRLWKEEQAKRKEA